MMFVLKRLCANSLIHRCLCVVYVDPCFCTGQDCGGLRVGGADCLGPGAPTLSPDTHTYTNTHSLSLRFPRGVITVPIIIHASQGCSHAGSQLDTHKHSNSHTPPLDFEPMLLYRPRSASYTEKTLSVLYKGPFVLSFSITRGEAGNFVFSPIGSLLTVQNLTAQGGVMAAA